MHIKKYIFYSIYLISLASMGQIIPMLHARDPYILGKQVCAPGERPDDMPGYTCLDGPPKVGQKVLVKCHDSSYCFGFVEFIYPDINLADIIIGEATDSPHLEIDYSDKTALYIHASWYGARAGVQTFSKSNPTFYMLYPTCTNMLDNAEYTPFAKKVYNDALLKFYEALCSVVPSGGAMSNSYYLQKLTLSREDRVLFFGDIHGDIRSFLDNLGVLIVEGVMDEYFSLDPHTYLVFLGDYVDRGQTGFEVWYTLFRLKAKNPNNVIILRGNHEEMEMNESFDFAKELAYKLNRTKLNERALFYKLYDFLPAALYIKMPHGDTYTTMLCCHGMPELGFSAQPYLSSSEQFIPIEGIDRENAIKNLSLSENDLKVRVFFESDDLFDDCEMHTDIPENKVDDDNNGKMLLDIVRNSYTPKLNNPGIKSLGFFCDDLLPEGKTGVVFNPYRGLILGEDVIKTLCDNEGICFILRGHQHGELFDQLKAGYGCTVSTHGLVATLISGQCDQEEIPFILSRCCLQFIDGAWQVSHKSSNGNRLIKCIDGNVENNEAA